MANAKPVVVASDESTIEGLVIDVVTSVTSGDCAVVRGAMAGWQLRDDAVAARDARVAHLVAQRRLRMAA